jgi:hypothetical protein
MFVRPNFRISYGPCLSSEPRSLTIPATPDAALRFALRLDHEANELLSEGRHRQAERLSHLALEARCRATGNRA